MKNEESNLGGTQNIETDMETNHPNEDYENGNRESMSCRNSIKNS